ncbi:MAG: hypothetical protein NW206_05070 [Hyphomonadaceae bacterium]|nr:hypothetical protein [Hyphomonadaceae bacterium]
MRILAGEVPEDIDTPESQGKDPAAVSLGKRGAAARAKSLSPKKRSEIAKKAAAKRWKRRPSKHDPTK